MIRSCCLVQIVSFVLIIKETTRWSWCFLMHSSERVKLTSEVGQKCLLWVKPQCFWSRKHKSTQKKKKMVCMSSCSRSYCVLQLSQLKLLWYTLIIHFSSTSRAINNWLTREKCMRSSRDGLCLQSLFYSAPKDQKKDNTVWNSTTIFSSFGVNRIIGMRSTSTAVYLFLLNAFSFAKQNS